MTTLAKLVVALGLDDSEFKKGTQAAQQTAKNSVDKIGGAFKGLNAIWVAAAGSTALIALKKAFDMGAEGQKLIQVRGRYDALIQSIGGSQATLQNLVDVTGKQVTNFDAMASAASLMQLRLADSEAELEKHFEIVTRLKKPHEEFGVALENWSLLLANKSIPRLDSFGLSGSQVRDRWRELTKVIGDSDEAFKLAVFEEAEKAMTRLGEETPVSEFEQFQVGVQNLTDEFKILLAQGLGPVVKTLVGGYGDAVDAATKKTLEAVDVLGDFTDAGKELVAIYSDPNFFKFGAPGGPAAFIQEVDAAGEGIVQLARRLVVGTTSQEEWIQRVNQAGISTEILRRALANADATMFDMVGTGDGLVRLFAKWQEAQRQANEDSLIAARLATYQGDAVEGLGFVYEQQTPKIRDLVNLTDDRLAQGQAAVADAEARRKAEEELTAAMEAEKVAAAALRVEIGRGLIEELGRGTEETINWKDELFQMAAQAGATQTALLNLGLDTGLYSEAQLTAAIRTAATRAKIEEIALQVAAGKITWMEARDMVDEFISSLDRVPTTKHTTFTWNFEGPMPPDWWSGGGQWDMPGGGASVGGPGQPGEGTTGGGGGGGGGPVKNPPEFQYGGHFVVPPGYPNDSFWMRATTGEEVDIKPVGGSRENEQVVTTVGPVEIVIQGISDPRKVAEEVSQRLARLTRLNAAGGRP